MRVLLTRPLAESRALAEILEEEGIEPLIWPLTRIVPTVAELKLPFNVDALLFTSANGVRALAALTDRRELPALCVGGATARAARKAGFVNCFTAEGDVSALVDLARRSGLRNFVHPRGRDAAGDLKGWLAESGQSVADLVLYEARETGPPPAPVAAALARGRVDLVTIWSPRNATILARNLGTIDPNLAATELVAISPAAAAPLAGAGFHRVIIAESPNSPAMLAAIRRAFGTAGQENRE